MWKWLELDIAAQDNDLDLPPHSTLTGVDIRGARVVIRRGPAFVIGCTFRDGATLVGGPEANGLTVSNCMFYGSRHATAITLWSHRSWFSKAVDWFTSPLRRLTTNSLMPLCGRWPARWLLENWSNWRSRRRLRWAQRCLRRGRNLPTPEPKSTP
jgi:hypothetical protein